MTTPRHNKEGFFKYYTAEAAMLTLEKATRRWSTPILFNDPFDNQFDLHFEEPSEYLARLDVDQFLEVLVSPEPLEPSHFWFFDTLRRNAPSSVPAES